jgi:hypothetical protein
MEKVLEEVYEDSDIQPLSKSVTLRYLTSLSLPPQTFARRSSIVGEN